MTFYNYVVFDGKNGEKNKFYFQKKNDRKNKLFHSFSIYTWSAVQKLLFYYSLKDITHNFIYFSRYFFVKLVRIFRLF